MQTKRENHSENGINNCPKPIRHKIFSFLQSKELCNLSFVNKFFKEITFEERELRKKQIFYTVGNPVRYARSSFAQWGTTERKNIKAHELFDSFSTANINSPVLLFNNKEDAITYSSSFTKEANPEKIFQVDWSFRSPVLEVIYLRDKDYLEKNAPLQSVKLKMISIDKENKQKKKLECRLVDRADLSPQQAWLYGGFYPRKDDDNLLGYASYSKELKSHQTCIIS
ncbi:MAG: F-box protein [Legionella longbeachae]|nr:F-box protein [Legionella longbeachae]